MKPRTGDGFSLLPGRPWSATRRLFLWGALVVLIVALLAMLMWLATWYDNTQVQDRLDRDAADVAGDIRTGLARNVERLQALQARVPFTSEDWAQDARSLTSAPLKVPSPAINCRTHRSPRRARCSR